MACAVFANIALLMRFLERHVRVTTLVAMAFLTTHDIINVVVIAIFGVYAGQGNGPTFGQAYWSSVASTIISSITNVTLVIDYARTRKFAKSGSGLTHKQRSLVMIVMILLVWIAVGAGVYSALIDIPFHTSLYFTVVTIETIGFGDITPKTVAARIFTFFYALIGLLNIALAVTTMRGLIAESFRHARRIHRKRVARLRAERERKKAEAAHHTQEQEDRVIIGGGRGGPGLRMRFRRRSTARKFVTDVWLAIRHPLGVKHDFEDHDSFHEETGSLHATRHDDKHLLNPRSSDPSLEETLEDEIKDSEGTETVRQLILSLIAFILFWLLGSLVFHFTENWSYTTAMYFCFISWATIGYGDLTPTSRAGQAVFVVWALLGVGSLTILISVIAEGYAGVFGTALRNRRFETLVYDKVRARHDSIAEERERKMSHFTEQLREDKLKLADALIEHAHTYHPPLRFMLGVEKRASDVMSENLRKLLIAELGDCDHIARETILHDPHIRKTLFVMSYDASFEELIQIANAIRALETLEANECEAKDEGRSIGVRENTHRSLHSVPTWSYSHLSDV